MNILPIVHRELSLAARRRSTYISRSLLAGILILLWLIVTASMARHMSMAEAAKALYWTYGILAMLYAVLSGVFFTADALSVERRDGTLGLLFLTDLKGYDVVLGKLVATSWRGVYALLVILPVLVLPLLMGGVSAREMGRLVVVLLSTAFYSLALGLLVSTVCRRLVTVVATTVLILVIQSALPWLAAYVLDEFTSLGAEDIPLIFLCPFTSLVFMQDVSYRSLAPGGWIGSGAVGYWVPVAMLLGLGVLALLAACWWLPRAWRRDEEPRRLAKSPRPIPSNRASAGSRLFSPVSRKNPCVRDLKPCHWLAARQRTRPGAFIAVFVGLSCVVLGCLGLSMVDGLDEGFFVAFFGAFVLHVLIKGWMALVSSRRFAEERRSGAMELLLVTPVPVQEIIRGEFAALKRAFALPLAVLTAVNLMLAAVILGEESLHLGDARWWIVEIALWGVVVLWLDARAIVHVGMLTGLKSNSHHRAALGTVLRVLVPPWAGVVFFFLFIMLPGGLSEGGFVFCMNGWFMLSAFLDVVWMLHARNTLGYDMRGLCAGDPPSYGHPLADAVQNPLPRAA